MKTVKKVILILFIVLIVVIAALGIWQRENINSFINSVRYSKDEISGKIDDNNKKMNTIVETTEYIDVRSGGLTAEEEKALADGEISQEDAIKIIRGQTSLEEIRAKKAEASAVQQAEQTEKPKPVEKEEQVSSQPSGAQTQKEPTKEEVMTDEVSNIVAELYVVKANFLSQLESTGQQMYNEYIATHYDRTKITSIVDNYLPVVASLESECDTTINGLLSQLETSLKKGGGDLGLVNEIRQYYYKEKSLKKSYYLNLIYENSN